MAGVGGAGLVFIPFRREGRVSCPVGVVGSSRKQEVRTVMTVMVTGAARAQEFIVPTSVVSG
ncbi:hypothetical protein GCM10010232_37420 [Streptomyces amakusaensis]